MLKVDIRQSQTAPHPGVLTQQDIEELVQGLPARIRHQEPTRFIPPKKEVKSGLAEEYVIADSFAAGAITNSMLSELIAPNGRLDGLGTYQKSCLRVVLELRGSNLVKSHASYGVAKTPMNIFSVVCLNALSTIENTYYGKSRTH